MRRNETILVYGVTGLLFVILFVAVVFGNEGQALEGDGGIPIAGVSDDPDKMARELADLLNLEPAVELDEALAESHAESLAEALAEAGEPSVAGVAEAVVAREGEAVRMNAVLVSFEHGMSSDVSRKDDAARYACVL